MFTLPSPFLGSLKQNPKKEKVARDNLSSVIIIYFSSFSLWDTADCAQGLLLDRYTGIIPGGFGEPYRAPGIKHVKTTCKANAFPTILSLQPLS